MGRGRPTEENFYRLSIGWVRKHCLDGSDRKRKHGSLTWSRNERVCCSISYEIKTIEWPGWMRVQYTNANTGQRYDYKIYFTVTYPHYGGERLWFLCPAMGCRRCVGVLYLDYGFACRHCRNIAYVCQNVTRDRRLLYKAQKIHRQLGGNWAADCDTPPKPKGMHWKTYYRKIAALERADNGSMAAMAKMFA